jgi:hypothetical protein
MAAWSSGSAIFNQLVKDSIGGLANAPKLNTDAFKVALFNNTTVPDNTVTAALSAFNAGVWVLANEVTGGANWLTGGIVLASPALTATTNYVMLDATDTAGVGNVTIANAYGDLLYDTTSTAVVGQGVAFHSYGGSPQGVTAGTFTVIWHANGLARWTHAQA